MSLFLMPLKTVFCAKVGEGRKGMNTGKVFLGLCNVSGIKRSNGKLTLFGNPHPAKQIQITLHFL